MPSLTVPHLQQSRISWCLPACVAMVSAYWGQPLLQDDVARWLGTRGIGTPASRVLRLRPRGFDVIYQIGSLADLYIWIGQETPCILFVRTGDLPDWEEDVPHAVVLTGFDGEFAVLLDPGLSTAPTTVSNDALMLAWSHFDYAFAILRSVS